MKNKKNKSKKGKVIVTFDEDSRRDFILGFRKRKNMRRKKAKDQQQKMKKDCIRNAKQKKKKELERKVAEPEQIANEISDEATNNNEPVTYDYADHFVTVTTIGDVDLNPDVK